MPAHSNQRRDGLRLLLATVVAALIFFAHLPQTRDSILSDDSADYMHAAKSSLLSTWLNTNSVAPWQFAQMRSKPGFRAHPWDTLYVAGDNAALRHFHGPVSFYAMHAVDSISHNHRWQRLLTSLVGSLISAALFCVLVEFRVSSLLSFTLAVYAGLQSRFVEVSVDPTPHVWYILFSIAFLFFFARFLAKQRPGDLRSASIALGFAFATLEFSVELFATIGVSLAFLFVCSRDLLPSWSKSRHSVLVAVGFFLLTTFVLWPGGWIRGGYLENYGLLTAQVLFKNKTAFGEHLTPGLIYRTLFQNHIILLFLSIAWLLISLALLLKRRLSITTAVFSIYTATALLLGIADHFRLNTYVSEFVIFLVAAAGLAFTDALALVHTNTLKRTVGAALSFVLVIGCLLEWQQRHDDWGTRPWLATVINGVSEHVPSGSSVLVSSDKEALGLYLPQYHFRSTAGIADSQPRSAPDSADTHFGLFDDRLPLPAGAVPIAQYPTHTGHSYVLWSRL